MWQRLADELGPSGVDIVSVAIDAGGADAVRPFVPDGFTIPVLLDTTFETVTRFGFVNIPMAVWIDEDGRIVRPPHSAQVKRSPLRDMDDPDGDDPISHSLRMAKRIPDRGDVYPTELRDWAANGADSPLVVDPLEVAGASRRVGTPQAEAAACFELGRHRWSTGDREGARMWWKRAHDLDPGNWAYKRQAWSLETTADGQMTDLLQEASATYGTGWAAEVERLGPDTYYPT